MKTAALVFAAGMGTRLRPVTNDKPKALVPVTGKTLLEIVIENIVAAGIHDIVVNVHHFAEQIIQFINNHSFDANIQISDERNLLRDTAGGLKYAEPLLSDFDHVLLHNVDIISNININSLINNHIQSNCIATLAVKERLTSRYFIIDESNHYLCGWTNHKTGEKIMAKACSHPVEYAFSGIHVINRQFFDLIPDANSRSLTPLYLDLASQYNINTYIHNQDQWMDIGKYEEYDKMTRQHE